jgi:hypothetical protein
LNIKDMKYRRRAVEERIRHYAGIVPVVVLVGARQVGKSTLLANLFGKTAKHIVFDPVVDVGNARSDPEFFLDQNPPPVILDEIQYAPELLGCIKRRVDVGGGAGQYFLTGSQNPAVLRGIGESLAGRSIIVELGPMSLLERCDGVSISHRPWTEDLFAGDSIPRLQARQRLAARPEEPSLFARLWRGGFPRLLDMADDDVPAVLGSYVQTYVERDVRVLANVEDLQLFGRFVALCAALTAREINHAQLGRELGVSPQTASRWLATLKATYQWIEVPPFHGNTLKRVSKHAKGYFSDTGLASFLHRVSSPDALAGNPLLGSLFETHIVNEIRMLSACSGVAPRLWHWRTHGGAEVDLILERDGLFVSLEAKSGAAVSEGDARGIRAFRATHPDLRHGVGVVVAAVPNVQMLRDNIVVVPYDIQ